MSYYFTGFVRSAGGLLKMVQILIGLVLMLILMAGHYDVSTGLYRLRIDAFLMTLVVFTFLFTSALLLMCTIMGTPELPNSVLYRINYLFASFTYFPFAVGFIFEEYMHGDFYQTIAAGVLSLTNSFVYLLNLCVSYQLRWLQPYRRTPEERAAAILEQLKKAEEEKEKNKENEKLQSGLKHVRTEQDLLRAADIETLKRYEELARLKQLGGVDPFVHGRGLQGRSGFDGGGGGGMEASVFRGEFLPGEEMLMMGPPRGQEHIVKISGVSGKGDGGGSPSKSPKKPKDKKGKKGKDKKSKGKKGKKGGKKGKKKK